MTTEEYETKVNAHGTHHLIKKCTLMKEGRRIPEEQPNSYIENKLTTPWPKMKKTNRQTIAQKKLHRKLKTEQHEPHQKMGVISGYPEDEQMRQLLE